MTSPDVVPSHDGGDDNRTDTARGSSPDQHYGRPETYFVFIVGNNGEWEEGRKTEGDIALWRAHLDVGISPDRIVFVRDQQVTKGNCEEKLQSLLTFSMKGSTLVFYYGGHGDPNGFCLHDEEVWLYRDVIRVIDSNFYGDRVLILADCCSSGNLGLCLHRSIPPRHSYVCLMSSQPFVKAGPEWAMTKAWLRAMKCSNGELPLRQVIDYTSDEMAKIKGDAMTIFLSHDVNIESCHWLPQQPTHIVCPELRWNSLRDHIPNECRVLEDFAVGDRVCVKHRGKNDKATAPVWFNAYIVSEMGGTDDLELRVLDQICEKEWIVNESRQCLLNELSTSSTNVVPSNFNEAQCRLAEHCRYLDFSFPTGADVLVRDDRGEGNKKAIVLDWRNFDWDEFMGSEISSSKNQPAGPYIAVLFEEKEVQAVVPLSEVDDGLAKLKHINIVKSENQLQLLFSEADDPQRAALFKSIELSEKTLCDAQIVFGTMKLSCYWPDDGEWYDAEALDPTKVPIDILATHCLFTINGVYCPVHYEDDTSFMVPLCYIRKRSRACPCDSIVGFLRY